MSRFPALQSLISRRRRTASISISMKKLFTATVLLASLLHPLSAFDASASEGVIEINHVCATETGCFSGDSAGYPVLINGTAGRSYHLTSDLTIPNSTDGIRISGQGVTLDLRGFAIMNTICSFTGAISCSYQAGTGSGIIQIGNPSPGIRISNGSVQGFLSNCVQLGVRSAVSNLRVRWCGMNGIQVGNWGRILNSSVYSVIGDGISTGQSALATGNTVTSASGDCIQLGVSSSSLDNNLTGCLENGINAPDGAALISRNSVASNGLRGIFVNSRGSTVSGNSVNSNSGDGIRVTEGSHVIDNTVYGNIGNGISAFGASSVQRNAVRGNAGIGINMSGSAVYRENVVSLNTGGNITGGVNLGSNSCDSTTTCP